MPKDVIKIDAKTDRVYQELALPLNETVWIGETQLNFLDCCSKWGTQAKLGLTAPASIKIYRLEVFARKAQSYQQILDIQIGETLVLDNIKIEVLEKIGGSVLLRVQSSSGIFVKRSFFNRFGVND